MEHLSTSADDNTTDSNANKRTQDRYWVLSHL